MVEVRGNALTHTAEGHRPLPMATDRGVRPTHKPQQAKPTGLDWSAISPPCSLCGNGSSELRDGLCPLCRGVLPTPKDHKEKGGRSATSADGGTYDTMRHDDVERRYEKPAEAGPPVEPPPSVDVPPGPRPAAPVAEEPDPDDPSTWAWVWPKDVDHVAQVLVRAAESEDPVARLLRLNILSAAESLYLYLEHQRFGEPSRPVEDVQLPEPPSRCFETPGTHAADCAAAPVEVAPVAPEPEVEAPRHRKWARIPAPVAAEIVERYKAGEGAPTIMADLGCSVTTIYNVLARNGVERRAGGR